MSLSVGIQPSVPQAGQFLTTDPTRGYIITTGQDGIYQVDLNDGSIVQTGFNGWGRGGVAYDEERDEIFAHLSQGDGDNTLHSVDGETLDTTWNEVQDTNVDQSLAIAVDNKGDLLAANDANGDLTIRGQYLGEPEGSVSKTAESIDYSRETGLWVGTAGSTLFAVDDNADIQWETEFTDSAGGYTVTHFGTAYTIDKDGTQLYVHDVETGDFVRSPTLGIDGTAPTSRPAYDPIDDALVVSIDTAPSSPGGYQIAKFNTISGDVVNSISTGALTGQVAAITRFNLDSQFAVVGNTQESTPAYGVTVYTTDNPSPNSVVGTVFDPSGQPVPSASISAEDEGSDSVGSTTTDSRGVYGFTVPSGSITFTADKPDWFESESVTRTVGQSRSIAEFVIERKPATITGTVVDAKGDPVEGSPVVVFDGDSEIIAEAQTAPDGTYSVDATPGISATVVGAGSIQIQLPLQINTTEPGNDFQYGGLDLNLVSPDGNPLADVPVSLAGEETKTDAGGAAEFVEVPPDGGGGQGGDGGLQKGDGGTVMLDGGLQSESPAVVDRMLRVVGRPTGVEPRPDPGQIDFMPVQVAKQANVTAVDADSGGSVRGISAVEQTSGYTVDVGGSGTFSLFAVTPLDSIDGLIADGDRRYSTTSFQPELDDGEEADLTLELERKENTGTTV